MKWILEKNKSWVHQDNYFHQFRNFDLSISAQLQEIEEAKKNLPESEHISIDIQKHLLLVGEIIEEIGCINSDDVHENIDPVADSLNQSALKLFQEFFKKL